MRMEEDRMMRGRKEKVGKEEERGREKGEKEGSWQHGLTRKEKKERKGRVRGEE